MPSYGAYGMPEAVKLYQALTQHDQIIYQLLARYLCRCNTKFATKVMPWGQPCHCHWLISEPACYTNKILILKQSSSDMCSAIPTALLCMIVFGNEWEQGTAPKGLVHRGWLKASKSLGGLIGAEKTKFEVQDSWFHQKDGWFEAWKSPGKTDLRPERI